MDIIIDLIVKLITIDKKDMVNIRLWNIDFFAFLVIWGPMEAVSQCDMGSYKNLLYVRFNNGGGTWRDHVIMGLCGSSSLRLYTISYMACGCLCSISWLLLKLFSYSVDTPLFGWP